MAITQILTTMPPSPNRTRPSTFSTESDLFLAAMVVLQSEVNTVISQINSTLLTMQSLATGAVVAAAEAASASTAAIAAANVAVYSGATTYDFPDAVVCTDGNTYRCVGTGVLDDNPVTSITGNWVKLTSQLKFMSFNSFFQGGR